MKRLKKVILEALSFPFVIKGFSGKRSKQWVRKIYSNFLKDHNHSIREKLFAYKNGFMPRHIDRFGINKNNINNYISERDYYYLQPINGIYRKWLANKVTTRRIFHPFSDHLQKLYYQLSMKNGKFSVMPLDDCPYKNVNIKNVIKLINKRKSVVVTDLKRNRSVLIKYNGKNYLFGRHKAKDEAQLLKRIARFGKKVIIAEYVRPHGSFKNNYHDFGNQLRLIVCNASGKTPEVTDAFIRTDAHYSKNGNQLKTQLRKYYIADSGEWRQEAVVKKSSRYFRGIISHIDLNDGSYNGGKFVLDGKLIDAELHYITGDLIKGKVQYWDEIVDCIKDIGRYAPQLQFFAVDVIITAKTFKFVRFINIPKYPSTQMFNKQTVEFLQKLKKQKLAENKIFPFGIKRACKQLKLRIRRRFSALFFPKGLLPYLSVRWIQEVLNDFFKNREVGFRTKFWAYSNGFLSYRIPQYGINEENRKNYISDFEYKWLRHINGNYRSWFEDKITFKYILPKYKDCLPEYYYHIKLKDGKNQVIPMMDCPKGYKDSYEDILLLAREKMELALKPDEGSHGDGFYKLSYEFGEYFLNGSKTNEKEIIAILDNPENSYLVTEYINNHPQFKKIYDGAVNTIRIIVFKMDGKHAEIGNTYMRIGSTKTGAVDNMGAGGMFAEIDIESGKYSNAKIITNNSILPCPYHPDTNVKIEGYVPHWEEVKERVIEIADNIPQLEYFGFDVAITENGIKLPEINRFPDYPKIEKFSEATMEYLLKKLKRKKHRYGYDISPCRTIVHLPKR